MPKRRSPASLTTQCVIFVCKRMEYFAQMETLDCLPSNILVRLFDLLKKTGHLTRTNLQLLIASHLDRINLTGLYSLDLIINAIITSRPRLVEIDLSNILEIPNLFWNDVIPSLDRLQVLNLRSTNCGDRELAIIANHCTQLRHLDLSLCHQVTNCGLVELCRGPARQTLQHLDIMHTRVEEKGVRQVLEECPVLVSLKWRNTINVLGQIYRTSPSTDSFRLQQLFSDASYRPYSLIPGAIRMFRNVTQVIIDNSPHLSANDLCSLEHLDSLSELKVISDLDFEEAFGGILIRHGAKLKHLTLGRIRNVNLGRIGKLCRRLSWLELERNQNYYCKTPIPIGSLETFILTVRDRNPGSDSDRDMSASTLTTFLSAEALKRVEITASLNVNEDTLSSLGGQLERFELELCPSLSTETLMNVIHRSKELSVLKVYRCLLISDDDLQNLSRLIRQMQWDLDLDYYHYSY